MHVNGAGGTGKIIPPNLVQKLFPGEDLFRVLHKEQKQLIFGVGQVNGCFVNKYFTGNGIERDFARPLKGVYPAVTGTF